MLSFVRRGAESARRQLPRHRWLWIGIIGWFVTTSGCSRAVRDDLDYEFNVYQTVTVPEFGEHELVQFESVFWEPDDTVSMRKELTKGAAASQRTVLEIGTGTGLLSLVCLANGATRVLATDVNPAAVANAKYNAAMLELEDTFEVRQVNPAQREAFSVIKSDERFDLIVSNPPWEDGQVERPADSAFYDPGFALMDSLLEQLPNHLNAGGRCLLAYGHTPAIKRLLSRCDELGYQSKVLDDRSLDELPQDFLPGMMVEIRLGRNPIPKAGVSSGQ